MSEFQARLATGKSLGGKIVGNQAVSDFQFIESLDKEGVTRFEIFQNGERMGIYAHTIDEALISAIAHKYDGDNTRVVPYIMRLINFETSSE